MKPTFKHLELFAGIGGFRKAIDLYCDDNGFVSECLGFSEKDKYANLTYKANFELKTKLKLAILWISLQIKKKLRAFRILTFY